MNTFLEKVTRSPNAASRIAAASRISAARSRDRSDSNSGDISVDPVRRMIGGERGEIARRVDVLRQARPAQDRWLDGSGARLFGMACSTRLLAREGKAQDRRRLEQQRVGPAVLRLGDHHRTLLSGLD